MKTILPRVGLRSHSLRLLSVSSSCFLLLMLSCLRLSGQTCNDLSVISLDSSCTVLVTPDMVLEGVPVDTNYVVSLTTLSGIQLPNPLTAAHLGDTIKATVTDTTTGNSCWGLLFLEDKLAPVVTCMDIELPCAVTEFSPNFLSSEFGLPEAYPTVVENCGLYTQTYSDTWLDLACNDPQDNSARLVRVWTVTDESGNQAVCTQILNFRRVHASEVLFPDDFTALCSNPLTDPVVTGQPYIEAFGWQFPLFTGDIACELNVVYQDQAIPLCGSSYNILRTWTVLDDCQPVIPTLNPRVHIQVISVKDLVGPQFQCPKDLTVSTDPFFCAKNFDLPDVLLWDDCAAVSGISATFTVNGIPKIVDGQLSNFPGNNPWDSDTLGVLGFTGNLPAGITIMHYTAWDACGNSNSCTFRVTVSDGVVPWAVCDEFTKVGLGLSGEALVFANTFDDGSGDNCSPVQFKARRVKSNSCQATDQFFDKVKFCCADVGDTIDVILRVYDLPVDTGAISLTEQEAHSGECLVRVFVEDKLKPACIPPLHQTINCGNYDPSLKDHGMAAFADNCCLDKTYELPPNYTQFDTLCNRGTIVRTFRAQDCYGLTSQCTQRLIIEYYSSFAVQFPDDVFVSDCDTTGVYGPSPVIYGADCETVAISHQDNVSTAGILSCYWIERTWMVIDWCNYNPGLPLIEVPNPNPAPDPLNQQNIAGPMVAPLGHVPPPTKMRITPNDPEPTDYSIFWAAEANGYVYRQVISVRDDQPPKIRGCPSTLPVEFCDHTDNDAQFWNASYWSNPHVAKSNDLCEGPVELAVTASDGCSKGNVGIRYFLFLDLDGNGIQETVINSLNPPPANTVYFGNALNPGYHGGDPRAFDFRPVDPDEKYRFTIVRTGFVNVTGYVRWVSERDPTKFVLPQLPYGNHRIQWIIDDGCGNETICEYPILVRDCLVPDLLCLNGLSVDIPQDKSITLYTTDFLKYTDDNCTPASQLTLGLRKSGTGTGFPMNQNGDAQQSATFTCDDLGPQFVELWVIDNNGNFNVCETYVIVQDNFGICPVTHGSVAGLLHTESYDGLEDATVYLLANHPALPPLSIFGLSDDDGVFRFTNALPFGAKLLIQPAKDNDPLNGVSTYDLVLINKHILGQQPLGSPYQLIAADVNNNGSVTTFDIVELRKLILGIYTELPNNNSWRFVHAGFMFPNPYNPFQTPFPETREVDALSGNQLQEDFIAIKVGDVNSNAVTNSLQKPEERSSGTLLFDVYLSNKTADDQIKAGEQCTVTLAAADVVLGCQLTLLFPGLELLRLDPGTAMTPENFGQFANDHALTMSWDGPGKPAFTLTFRASETGRLAEMLQLSSRITRTEAYRQTNGPIELMTVALRFNTPTGTTVKAQSFEAYSPQPNPWSDYTTLGFYVPEAGDVTLKILDQTGRLLYTETRFYAKGNHSLKLNAAQVPASGMLFYQLETDWESASGKMQRL